MGVTIFPTDLLSSQFRAQASALGRPPVVALVNIMDNARSTERHFRRLIEAAHPNAEIIPCRMSCAATDKKYFKESEYLLSEHYANWHDVIGKRPIDLVIVTGINRGSLTYHQLEQDYPHFWQETKDLLDKIDQTTTSGQTGHSLLICWSAFAAMKLYSGVDKGIYDQKLYGLFNHTAVAPHHPLLAGLQSPHIRIPQSRMSYMDETELRTSITKDHGEVLVEGPGGPAIWTLHNGRVSCMINHPEYSRETLHHEYLRDSERDQTFPRPLHYNPDAPETEQDFARLGQFCRNFYKNIISYAHAQKEAHSANQIHAPAAKPRQSLAPAFSAPYAFKA